MKRRTALRRGIAIIASAAALNLLLACSPEGNDRTSENETLVRAHAPVIGPKDAPVTIVEYLDPSCEGCRAFYPYVKKLLAEYPAEVRLVVRYVPFHRGSETAIGILEAAKMQGVYEPVLQAVFASQPRWHDDPELKAAWTAAEAAGLNVERAREQMASPEVSQNLKLDIADAQTYKINRTPTFFVNGQPVDPLSPEQLQKLVQSEAERAGPQ